MKKIAILIASIFMVFSPFFMKTADFAYAGPAPVPASLTPVIADSVEDNINAGCKDLIRSFGHCMLWFFYVAIVQPSFSLVGIAAKILDFFLGYSLDSNSYTSDFIGKGWGLIRDISNVAFIFTLLYLAIRHILGMSAKKAIPTLIIVALLLNFSLFFTKVVIDAGNILARAFYKSIVINNDPDYNDVEGYKSISLGLVDKINPQSLLSKSLFSNTNHTGEYSAASNSMVGVVTPSLDSNMGYNFLVFGLVVMVNVVLIWVFLSVALLFVGRVIGLWFMMIFSPIAFITLAVPGSGGFLKQLSFDTWKDTVIKLSFVAPVFVFFLYLIISFLGIIFGPEGVTTPSENADLFTNLMKVFIPFIFIVVLLQAAKKTAESMAGDFGSAVKSFVGKVAGVVAGGALGASAFALRATAGRLASARLSAGNYNSRIADATQRAEDAKKSGDRFGQARALADLKRLEMSKASLEKMKNSSFDIRNAGKAKGFAGAMGRAGGFIAGQGMSSFGGAGFTAGAGSTQSRSSYEKEKEEEKIKKAGEIEQVGRNEFSPTIARMMKRGDGNDKVTAHIDKTLSQIDKDIKKAGAGSELGKKKQAEKDKILDLRRGVVAAGTDKTKAKAAFEGKTGKWGGAEAEKKEEMTRRRNMYADRVDEDAWYSATTGENEYTADKIRRGNKVQSDSEKQADEIAKAVKEALNQQPPPPPGTGPSPGTGNPPQPPPPPGTGPSPGTGNPPQPPPPPPPPGTGPTRGPGGGSAGAGTI